MVRSPAVLPLRQSSMLVHDKTSPRTARFTEQKQRHALPQNSTVKHLCSAGMYACVSNTWGENRAPPEPHHITSCYERETTSRGQSHQRPQIRDDPQPRTRASNDARVSSASAARPGMFAARSPQATAPTRPPQRAACKGTEGKLSLTSIILLMIELRHPYVVS